MKIISRAIQLLKLVPYGSPPTLNRRRLVNRPSAQNAIRLWETLYKTPPRTLVDFGANESQWAYWLRRKWPALRILSFEPDPKYLTLGERFHDALGDWNHTSYLGADGFQTCPRLTATPIHVRRFDEMKVPFEQPALLKIDCEDGTLAALRGCGSRLHSFEMVVIECCSDLNEIKALRNQQLDIFLTLFHYGLNSFEIVDAGWDNGIQGVVDVCFWRTKRRFGQKGQR